MPRPRETIVHRHAEQSVVARTTAAAARTAGPSTALRPARKGPVPRRQITTASAATAIAGLAHRRTPLTATPAGRRGQQRRRGGRLPPLSDGGVDKDRRRG